MENIININLDTQTAPEVREHSNRDWIEYGTEGYANLYPQFLVDLYYNSSTHAAIVNATAEMIAGEEITCEGHDNLESYVRLKKFIANANGKETLHEVVKKLAFDFKLQGGFALNIVWSKDRTEIAEIYHIPVERLRAGKPNEMGVVEHYYIHPDWKDIRKNPPKPVPAFNLNDRTSPSQILYSGTYSPMMDIYFVPDYVGGCNWALIDQKIAEFHLSNITNGFSGSYFISFANGIPTQEERYNIEKSITEKFTGAKASGKFVLTFSDDKNRTPEITPISVSNADKQYLALQELMTQNILVAHRVTSPMLMGIKNDTGLGNNAEELNSAFEVYLNTVVMPYQNHILKVIGKICEVNNCNIPLSFTQAKPITSKWTIEDMKEVMTPEEIREELGLSPLGVEEENEYGKKRKYKASEQRTDLELGEWLETHGEVPDESWKLIEEEDAGQEYIDFEKELNLQTNLHLAKTTGQNYNPNAKSEQDGQNTAGDKYFRVRYAYNEDMSLTRKSGEQRTFCKMMMNASKNGKVYRKEEISPDGISTSLSNINANKGFGPKENPAHYDIFKFKGGANCHHRWYRKIFMTRIGEGSTHINAAEIISTTKARNEGFAPKPNEQEVPVAPKQMKNKGYKNKR